mgnify:CR=1 FL=1
MVANMDSDSNPYDNLWADLEESTEENDDMLQGESSGCPVCGASESAIKINETRGERYCDLCGHVLEQNMIDHREPTRRFSKDDPSVDNSHHGAPTSILFPDKGLTTTFNPWEGKQQNRLRNYILKRTNKQTVTNKERNLAVALSDLARIISRMGLPKPVHYEAANIYRKAVDAQLIRGRSIEGVVAASLYAACRMCDVPRTLDEIALGTRTGRKEIARNWTTLRKRLPALRRIRNPSPESFLERFGNQLKLSIPTTQRARDLLTVCFDGGIDQGKNPVGIVAACIYIACNELEEKRTQREIAQSLNITEVTIRNRYKEALKVMNQTE